MSFLETFQDLVPSWLSEGEGGKVLASLSLMLDDYRARAKAALLARFPGYAPDDAALGALGRDRRLVRGLGEPAASYAARQMRFLDDHRVRGNPWALLEQIRTYLQTPCVVRTVDRRGNWFTIEADGSYSSNIDQANWVWDSTEASPNWGRFWVIIYPIDAARPWAPSSSVPFASRKTIGTTATANQIAGLRAIIRDWKRAGTKCEWIIVAFDDATFEPSGSTDPAGAWRHWSTVSGETRAARRLGSARYFTGT